MQCMKILTDREQHPQVSWSWICREDDCCYWHSPSKWGFCWWCGYMHYEECTTSKLSFSLAVSASASATSIFWAACTGNHCFFWWVHGCVFIHGWCVMRQFLHSSIEALFTSLQQTWSWAGQSCLVNTCIKGLWFWLCRLRTWWSSEVRLQNFLLVLGWPYNKLYSVGSFL